MGTPDKIYFNADGLPSYIDWDGSPIRTKQVEDSDVCYICKDLADEMVESAEDHAFFAGQEKFRKKLLAWAEKEMMKAAKQSDAYGRRNAFMDVIDKINSM